MAQEQLTKSQDTKPEKKRQPAPSPETGTIEAAPETAEAQSFDSRSGTANRLKPLQVLALQQRIGNRAVARMIKRIIQREPDAPTGSATAQTQDQQGSANGGDQDDKVDWVVPTSSSGEVLLNEVRAYVQRQAQKKGDPKLATLVHYFIVTDKLYVFNSEGAQQTSFELRPNADMLSPGYYLDDGSPAWKQYGRTPKEEGFFTFAIPKEAARFQLNKWLVDGAVPQLQQYMSSHGVRAVIMVIAPGGGGGDGAGGETPGWAKDQFANLQQALGKLKGQGQSGNGTGGGGTGDPSKDGGSGGSGGDRLPDRVVLLNPTPQGQFVNVWKHGAVQAIPLKEGETADQLMERIKAAAGALQDATDPNKSDSVKNPAAKTGFDEKATAGQIPQTPADQPTVEGATHTANAPGYPSWIRSDLEGASTDRNKPLTTAKGASNQFTMELDFSIEGNDTLSQVGARMQPINYGWELIKITAKEDANAAAGGAVNKDNRVGAGSAAGSDIARTGRNFVEDTMADLKDPANLAQFLLSPPGTNIYAISGTVQMVGALVKGYISIVTEPLNARGIGFSDEGIYVLRCIAQPHPYENEHIPEDKRIRRASSVAFRVVNVLPVNKLAEKVFKEGDDADQKALADLKAQLGNPNINQDKLQQQIAEVEAAQHDNTPGSIKRQLDLVEQKLTLLRQLRDLVRGGTNIHDQTLKIDPNVRILDVQLQLQKVTYDAYEQQLVQQEKYLKDMGERAVGFAKNMKAQTYRPKVVLASEENGQTYNLVSMLGEAADSTDKRIHYQFVDVTIPDTQNHYDGRSTQEGIAGHQEAIQNALYDFRNNCHYGRGTILVRLPPELNADLTSRGIGGTVTVEPAMRRAPGPEARAMQHLKDLAEAAAVAGLVVTGPAGLAVGAIGGVAGAAVAIADIHERVQGQRFKWDFQTIMDITAIIGGVVAVGNVATAGVRGVATARNLPAWVNGVQRVETGLHIIGGAMMGFQMISIPIGVMLEFEKIDEDNSLSPEEKQARKSEAILHAALNGAITIASAAQMLRGGEEPGAKPEEKTGGQQENQKQIELPSGSVPKGNETPSGAGEPSGTPTNEGGQGQKTPGNEAPAAGRGPTSADEGTVHPPVAGQAKLLKAGESFNAEMKQAISAAGPKGGTEPLFGRVRIVDDARVEVLWDHAQTTKFSDTPDAIGFHDTGNNMLYIARGRLTPETRAEMVAQVKQQIPAAARGTFGDSLVDAFTEDFINRTIIDEKTPQSLATDGGRAMLMQLETLVGADVMQQAMFGKPQALEAALTAKIGPERTRAVLGGLKVNAPENVIRLLSPSNPALANAFGEPFAAGVADYMARASGQTPKNARRAQLFEALANTVGADVLENALLNGDVESLRTTLKETLGEKNTNDLLTSVAKGNLGEALKAINAPVEKTTAPTDTPVKEPEATPDQKQAKPTQELGTNGAALKAAIEGTGQGDRTQLAEATFKEVGNFVELRRMVEAGRFGENREAVGAELQTVRKAIIKRAYDKIKAELSQKYPGVEFPGEPQNMGSDKFTSDIDITVRTHATKPDTANGAPSASDQQALLQRQIQASSEAVNRLYEQLTADGFPPDRFLDSNFYTDLHEAEIIPTDASGKPDVAAARQITQDQSVVSLAEMKMNMSGDQWTAYKQRQLASIDKGAQGQDVGGALGRQAKANMQSQFDAAEAMVDRLGVTHDSPAQAREAKLTELRTRLINEMGKLSPVEQRQLMAEIKLLEPDAYGSRAAYEGVVEYQQAMVDKDTNTNTDEKHAIDKIRAVEAKRGLNGADPELGEYAQELAISLKLATSRADRMAVYVQEASASLAKMYGHAKATGNGAPEVRALAKYLDRVEFAFHDAGGGSVRSDVLDVATTLVRTKNESTPDAATMRELKAWAKRRGLPDGTSDQQIIDTYVQRAQALGELMVTRARTMEQNAQAAEQASAGERTATGSGSTNQPQGGNPPGTLSPGAIVAQGNLLSVIESAYLSQIKANAGTEVEVGVYRRQVGSGYEYVVVQGSVGAVRAPLDGNTWEGVSHFHHGAENQPGFHNPAPQDLFVALEDLRNTGKLSTGKIDETIDSIDASGQPVKVEYGLDNVPDPAGPPGKTQLKYYVKPPGKGKLYFDDTYPNSLKSKVKAIEDKYRQQPDPDARLKELVALFRTIPSNYYARWWADQFVGI